MCAKKYATDGEAESNIKFNIAPYAASNDYKAKIEQIVDGNYEYCNK